MKQLVQLKKFESEFKALNCELVGILREEKEGVEGLKKAVEKTKFTPILLDAEAKVTMAYSQKNFATYFINSKGIVVGILSGTKLERPTGEVILKKAKEVFQK